VRGDIYSISIVVDVQFKPLVVPPRLRGIARTVLAEESVPAAELGIFIADEDSIRELNRKYAGENESTDVLSFSLTEGETFASPDGVLRLGDVVIAYPVAERQAQEAGRSAGDEVAHLLVHGILHLLGYDHAEGADERRMRAREEELLKLVGVSAGH